MMLCHYPRSPSSNPSLVASRYSPPVCWPRRMATTPSPAFGASRFASLPRRIYFQILWRGRSRGSCTHGYGTVVVDAGGDGGWLLSLLLGCSFGSNRCEPPECQGICYDLNGGGPRTLYGACVLEQSMIFVSRARLGPIPAGRMLRAQIHRR